MGETNPFKFKCKRKFWTLTTYFYTSKLFQESLHLSDHYKTYTMVSLEIRNFYQGNLLDY